MAETEKKEKLQEEKPQLESIPGWTKWGFLTIISLIIVVGIIHSASNKAKTHQSQAQIQTAQAQTVKALPETKEVILTPGEWSKSKRFEGPAGAYFHLEGPTDTRVRFANGEEGFITDDFGVITPEMSFYNETGGVVQIIINHDPIS
ncbi:MAG: hypothetical protein WC297_02470 [Candidatus Paceibacterota bacterium]|jgi:hypothetical protein